MRLAIRLIALLAVILGAGGFVIYEFLPWRLGAAVTQPASAQQNTGLKLETLWIENGDKRHLFHVEIADNDQSRQVGLMFRKDLADDAGMLFIYPQDKEIAMWMENTYVSLDMLFLNADGTIHTIAHDAEPLSRAVISSHGQVRGILEVKAGTARRLGLTNGLRVRAPSLGNASG
jgi:uncharacterized protein